ncbi:cysteine desulfurase [Corynebacterium sp. 13CS0277]|uniref:cysteine desulfurase family protein n=1 Tax=Corynebacterium sp. 13CS0277 TaxID=2071994 RepID=UPI000D046FB4|nr:cysteine desulfurase family protein [Corynebacterium sp. 13CS0277]PRQ10736.1 cysteine desulfurase [Corynebacterium sp. 13CS0277]
MTQTPGTARIYLDHAATTPLRDCAREAYLEHSGLLNPGGVYASGREARKVLEHSREIIAGLLGCEPIEVVFCASGTEADNLAVAGFARAGAAALRAQHPEATPRVLTSPLEHPAVVRTIDQLGHEGFAVDLLPLAEGSGGDGARAVVDMEACAAAARADGFHQLEHTTVATCQWANNETGALQPVGQLVALARDVADATGHTVPVHSDAVQAVGHVPVDFHASGLDSLAVSAHKFGGPRGLGLLLVRRSPAPQPVLFGGGQERGLRPGTVDVAAAAAAAAALSEATAEIAAEEHRLRGLREDLRARLQARIPGLVVHTPADAHALPGHLHLSVPGAEGDSLILLLDMAGVEASTGSACANGVHRASEVLLAMGVEASVARGAVRFTLGRSTTAEDVERVVELFPGIAAQAVAAGMA